MKPTIPGRLAAVPRRGTEPDRVTRIGFGAPTPPCLPFTCGNLPPSGRQTRFMRRGSRDARWSN